MLTSAELGSVQVLHNHEDIQRILKMMETLTERIVNIEMTNNMKSKWWKGQRENDHENDHENDNENDYENEN